MSEIDLEMREVNSDDDFEDNEGQLLFCLENRFFLRPFLLSDLSPCRALLESISETGYNIAWSELSYTAQGKQFSKKPPFISRGQPKKLLDNLEGFAAAGTLPSFDSFLV